MSNSSQDLSLGFDFGRYVHDAQTLLLRAQATLATGRKDFANNDAKECRELIAWIRQHPANSEDDEQELVNLSEIENDLAALNLSAS